MDEKKTDPSGYEPNFVMKDAADPEAAENHPNMAENQPTCRKILQRRLRRRATGRFRTESGFWRIK